MTVLWIDPDNNIFAQVSEEDYDWAIQWCWGWTPDKHGRKKYTTRNTRRRKETSKQIKVYLHKEILIRTGLKPRTKNYTIGDHRNGDSLDCRRENLRWATPSMNARNRKEAVLMPREDEIPFDPLVSEMTADPFLPPASL